jgi:hypothetical protein
LIERCQSEGMSQTHHKRPPSADTGIIHEVVWLNSGVCKSHLLAGLNVGSVLRPGNKDGRRATIVRSAFRSAPPYFLTRFLTRTRIHFVRKAIGGFALDGSAACGFTPDVHVFGVSARNDMARTIGGAGDAIFDRPRPCHSGEELIPTKTPPEMVRRGS